MNEKPGVDTALSSPIPISKTGYNYSKTSRNFLIIFKKKHTYIELISSSFVLLFMYAAVSKLLDYDTFTVQLAKSPFIMEFADLTAWALPIGEIMVALALGFGHTKLVGFYASLFLMTMFTSYIHIMLNYSYYIPCSCGGILSKMSWGIHLWFNVGFVLLSIVGILLQTQFQASKSDQWTQKRKN